MPKPEFVYQKIVSCFAELKRSSLSILSSFSDSNLRRWGKSRSLYPNAKDSIEKTNNLFRLRFLQLSTQLFVWRRELFPIILMLKKMKNKLQRYRTKYVFKRCFFCDRKHLDILWKSRFQKFISITRFLLLFILSRWDHFRRQLQDCISQRRAEQ